MIIADLIALLQKYPPQTKVLVQGYEDGYDNVTTVKNISVKHDPDAQWYNGKYVEGAKGENVVAVLGEGMKG